MGIYYLSKQRGIITIQNIKLGSIKCSPLLLLLLHQSLVSLGWSDGSLLLRNTSSTLLVHLRSTEMVTTVDTILITSVDVKINLVRKLSTLLSSSVSTNDGIVPIKVLRNLLKWGVASLDVVLPDNQRLKAEPDAVHKVVLPLDTRKRDWVNILVEEQRKIDSKPHAVHALSADVVWQNLHSVSDQQTRPGHVIETVIDEDKGNLAVCGGGVSGSWDNLSGRVAQGRLHDCSGHGCPDDVGGAHSGGSGEEERTTAKLVNPETHEEGDDEVDDGEDTIDLELQLRVGYASKSEDVGHVVRNETIAGPLREKTERHQDDETVTVALSAPELGPAVALELLLELDGLLDLVKLNLDEIVLLVSASVGVCENLKSLLLLALGHEETWGFWHEPSGLLVGLQIIEAGRSAYQMKNSCKQDGTA